MDPDLLCGLAQESQAPLNTLTSLAETSVQEALILRHLQHGHLRLAHRLLRLLRGRPVLLDRVLQDGDLGGELLDPGLDVNKMIIRLFPAELTSYFLLSASNPLTCSILLS